MKVGDLVMFRRSDRVTGIVMSLPLSAGNYGVGVWSFDWHQVEYELRAHLEVISESR